MSKQSITPFKLWFNYLCSKKVVYLIGVLAMLLTNSMQVFFIRGAGWLVDLLSGKDIPDYLVMNDKYSTFVLLFMLLLSGRILMTIGRFLWRITIARQSAHAAGNLKIDLWDSAKGFPLTDYHHRFTKGNLMSVATSDVQESRFLFGFTLVGLVDVLFLGAFCLIALFNLHFWLSVICLAGIAFLPPVIKKLGDREADQHREAQESLSDFNDLSSQVVSTIRLQRLSQTGRIWQKRLFDSADNYRSLRLKAIFTSLKFIPAMGGASVVIYALLFLSGIPFVLNGEITVGDFIAIQGLLFMLQAPLMELGFVISDWKKGMESLGRVCEVLNNEQEKFIDREGDKVIKVDSVIKISGLNYQIEDREIFKNFSLELQKGERVGITGTIGTGKSILLSLIGGITRVECDSVKFMGRSYDEYSNKDLRNHIAYVPQKPFLFAESIRDNLTLDREFSEEDLWNALEISDVAEDVRGLEHGLDTQLGEWGINLSGGQKQRITLARAIVRRPTLLLLDDCLSAVDTVTEENILNRIDERFRETTIVWVAHRDSTLKYCSRVVRLSNE